MFPFPERDVGGLGPAAPWWTCPLDYRDGQGALVPGKSVESVRRVSGMSHHRAVCRIGEMVTGSSPELIVDVADVTAEGRPRKSNCSTGGWRRGAAGLTGGGGELGTCRSSRFASTPSFISPCSAPLIGLAAGTEAADIDLITVMAVRGWFQVLRERLRNHDPPPEHGAH